MFPAGSKDQNEHDDRQRDGKGGGKKRKGKLTERSESQLMILNIPRGIIILHQRSSNQTYSEFLSIDECLTEGVV